MVPVCRIILTDLCPRLRARLTCNTSTVHESQWCEWLKDPWCEISRDHSCTLLNAKCPQPAKKSSVTYDRDCARNSHLTLQLFTIHNGMSDWMTHGVKPEATIAVHIKCVSETCSLRQIRFYCSPRFDCFTSTALLAWTVSLLLFSSLWLFHCYCSHRSDISVSVWMNNDFKPEATIAVHF